MGPRSSRSLLRNPGAVCVVGTLLATSLASPLSAESTAGQRKHVLILHSYHKDYPFTEREDAGIAALLTPEERWIERYVEYLDAKRVTTDEYLRGWLDLFKRHYAKVKFDAALVTDNDALEFLLKNRDIIGPDTPVLFAGINDFHDGMLAGHARVTGVIEAAEYAATIDLALDLRPTARRVVVVSDRTTTGTAHENATRDVEGQFRGRAEFVYWSLGDMTVDEMQAKLRALGAESVVLLLSGFLDRAGRVLSQSESMALLAGVSGAPVFAVVGTRVGGGAVGGRVVSGLEQGRVAAQMLLRVLRGEPIERIPVAKDSPNIWKFDYRELARWNISESQLPEGSEVINRPSSFYREYRASILGAGAAMAAMAVTICLLILNVLRRRRAEKELARYRDHLEELVKQRTEELEGSRQQLERSQRLAAIGTFATGIAHEINNPIGGILLAAGFAQTRSDMPEPVAQALRTIVEQANRSRAIVHNVMQFARSETTKKSMGDLNAVVRRAANLVGDGSAGREDQILLSLHNDLAPIVFNPTGIEQVVVNLCNNAFEAGANHVTILTDGDGREVRLSVLDNGSGIPPELQAQLFDPFFTTRRGKGGTGLGLSICYRIIEDHGGKIEVESEPGKGTRFTILLPCGQAEDR